MHPHRIDVAKALIRNPDGKYLVLQKSGDYEELGGKWELPGGKIEDEDRFETARREVMEETGLDVSDGKDVVRVEVDAEKCVDCYILFFETESEGVKLSDEHDAYKWVDADEFRWMDWHADAGYAVPAMVYLDKYLSEHNSYE